jgi:hypothetical protein
MLKSFLALMPAVFPLAPVTGKVPSGTRQFQSSFMRVELAPDQPTFTELHMATKACWWTGTKRSWPCWRAEWNYFLCRDVTWSESGRSWLNSILFPSGSLMK